jgi:hypothetical protein
VKAAVRGFECELASGVCLSNCQHPVVTGRQQLDFDIPGEFTVTR